jgi:hypothetical protein
MNYLRAMEPIEEEQTDRFHRSRASRRPRRKPWHEGLAAETVADHFEDAKRYRAFERAIVAGFAPVSTIELELVQRLASLFWRLRRASATETGLFQFPSAAQTPAQAFMELSKIDPSLLARASEHEAKLWRQAAQTIWLLDALRRPPPCATPRRLRKLIGGAFWDRPL